MSAPYPRPEERLPEWLYHRIRNVEEDNSVQYVEASMGPHAGLLQSYFPTEHSWMVQPTFHLRELLRNTISKTTSSKDNTANPYKQPVLDSSNDEVPGFAVCKVSGEMDGDVAVLIWEVNRESDSSATQVTRPEEWIRNYQEYLCQANAPGPVARSAWLAFAEKGCVTIHEVQQGPGGIRLVNTTKGPVLGKDVHDCLLKILEAN